MAKAIFLELGNQHLFSVIVGREIKHSSGLTFSSNATNIECPNCNEDTLSIEDSFLLCQRCDFSIPFVDEHTPFCSFCGSKFLMIQAKENIVQCISCNQDYQIDIYRKYIDLCKFCGKSYFSKGDHDGMCFKCNEQLEKEFQNEGKEDYLDTKEDLGYVDDIGRYHYYDED